MGQIQAVIEQIGPSSSKGTVRTHFAFIDRPTAKGGADRGPMGGEYLLVALGGCFMSNLLAAGHTRDAALTDAKVAVSGTIDGTPERFTAFTLNVSAACEVELLRKLTTIAERACIVSNTLKEAAPISIVVQESSADRVVSA